MFKKLERYLTYKNDRSVYSDLSEFNLVYNYLTLKTGEKIELVYKDNKSDYLILFAHGNAANISKLTFQYNFYEKLNNSYLVLDYPGYGQSTGEPSEELLYESLTEAYNFAINDLGYTADKIILHGLSLGGAVAIEVASKLSFRSAIFESTFTSSRAMGKKMFPRLKLYKFVKNKFKSIEKIANVNCPKLFIHGTSDLSVPYFMSEELFFKAEEPKFLYSIEACGHRDQIETGGDEYLKNFRDFIENNKIYITE